MHQTDIVRPSRSKSTYAILGLLTIRAMSGYDMKQAISESLAHFWSESYGSIYPILNRLADEGLVERTEGGGSRTRKVYSLTPEGRKEFQRWLVEPPEEEPPIRSEFLLKLFFGRHLPREQVRSFVSLFGLQQQRRLSGLRELEASIRNDRKVEADTFFWLLTLRRGILIAEARAAWAEEVLRMIEGRHPTKRLKPRGRTVSRRAK